MWPVQPHQEYRQMQSVFSIRYEELNSDLVPLSPGKTSALELLLFHNFCKHHLCWKISENPNWLWHVHMGLAYPWWGRFGTTAHNVGWGTTCTVTVSTRKQEWDQWQNGCTIAWYHLPLAQLTQQEWQLILWVEPAEHIPTVVQIRDQIWEKGH